MAKDQTPQHNRKMDEVPDENLHESRGSGVDHTSRETREGRVGLTGDANLGRREEFAGRENVTGEREQKAVPAEEMVERPSKGEGMSGKWKKDGSGS